MVGLFASFRLFTWDILCLNTVHLRPFKISLQDHDENACRNLPETRKFSGADDKMPGGNQLCSILPTQELNPIPTVLEVSKVKYDQLNVEMYRRLYSLQFFCHVINIYLLQTFQTIVVYILVQILVIVTKTYGMT